MKEQDILEAFYELVNSGSCINLVNVRVQYEYDRDEYYVSGYNFDDCRVTYVVVEADGPSSFNGITFEELP